MRVLLSFVLRERWKVSEVNGEKGTEGGVPVDGSVFLSGEDGDRASKSMLRRPPSASPSELPYNGNIPLEATPQHAKCSRRRRR